MTYVTPSHHITKYLITDAWHRGLNRINPKYEAKVVFIEVGKTPGSNHYVCSFKREDGKLYIMDYATAYHSMRGTHGPFNSLEEYKKYYENVHPKNKKTVAITFIDW